MLHTSPWLVSPLSDILLVVGWLLIAAMIALDVGAMLAMARAKTTIMPHKGTEHLVTHGPFSFTRNPIYLGNVLLCCGLALIVGSLWFLIAGLAAGFLMRKLAIEGEEKHLSLRFGKAWRDYAKRVRRWI